MRFAKGQRAFHFCGEPFVVEQAGGSWIEPVEVHNCPVKGYPIMILDAVRCFASHEEVILNAIGAEGD